MLHNLFFISDCVVGGVGLGVCNKPQTEIAGIYLTIGGKSQSFFSNLRSKHDLFFRCYRRFKVEC